MHLQATRTPLVHVEGDLIIHAHLHDLPLEKFDVFRLFSSKKKIALLHVKTALLVTSTRHLL